MRTVRSEKQMNSSYKPLRAAAVLLVLTMFSTWMLSGMLAKYVAKDAGTDSARVASFNVSADVQEGDPGQVLDIGDEASSVYYDFTLTNSSEVAVACNIKVVMDEYPPAGIKMVLDDDPNDSDDEGITISTVSDKKVYEFDAGIKMGANQDKTGQLIFTPGDVDYISFAQLFADDGLTYTKDYPFKVGVTFVQID